MDPKISVEYLFISKLSDSICIDDSGLRNILRSIRDVEVKNNTLKYKDVEFEFEIVHGNAESDKSVYFDITISTIPENLDPFAEVLRLIRTAINKITQNPPQVLWDGLGLYYSQLAYPKIYRVENMMRKLITKFMIINAGIGWHKQFVPKEVDQSIKSQANNDYLHNVDFIQLSVFLFKEYEVVATKPILEKIRKSSEVTALDLSELKGLVPQSNWDRYFAPIISCDADFLRTRWQALYDLRNAVAHNKSISRTDLERIDTLVGEVEPKISEAISKLSEIFVPNEEKVEIIDNAAANVDSIIGLYIRKFNELHETLSEFASFENICEKDKAIKMPFRILVEMSKKSNAISPQFANELIKFSMIRNELVHKASPDTSFINLEGFINRMDKSIKNLEESWEFPFPRSYEPHYNENSDDFPPEEDDLPF